jgi:hypothetical protein
LFCPEKLLFFTDLRGFVAIKKAFLKEIIFPILTEHFSRFYDFKIDIIGQKHIVKLFSCKETHFFVKCLL